MSGLAGSNYQLQIPMWNMYKGNRIVQETPMGMTSVDGGFDMSKYLQGQQDMYKQSVDFATGANAPKWADVQGVGGAMDWLTANRGGGQSYLGTGLAALGTVVPQLYGTYYQSKYQKKMGDLAERQQAIYEQEVKRQQEKQDKAQAAYDKAQEM